MSPAEQNVPSEAQINAWLDDELTPETRRLVDQAARADEQLAARLQLDSAVGSALRELFDPTLEAPLPARLLNAAGPRPWSWTRRLSAVAACVCVGVLIGWQAAQWGVLSELAGARPVTVEAAAAHAVFLPEVRHAVEVRSDEREHMDRWFSKRLTHELFAPDLRNHGMKLVGGRLLADAGQPAAMYMYESEDGERITIYARLEANAGPPTALRYARNRGFEVAHWVDHGMSYALTGKIPRPRLEQLARSAHEQM